MLKQVDTDVLIAGGGIGGLTLALALGRQGRRVTVIERLTAYPTIYKGEFLQSMTLALLEKLDVLERIRPFCVPVTRMTYGQQGGAPFFTVKYTDLGIPIPYGLNGDHSNIRGAVLGAVRELPGVTVLQGVSAKRVLWEGDTVVGLEAEGPDGPLRFRSRILVGADGIRSIIRSQLPIKVKLRSIEEEQGKICAFTLHLPAEPEDEVAFYFGRAVGCGSFPLPDRRVRVYLSMRNNRWEAVKPEGVAGIRRLVAEHDPRYGAYLEQLQAMKDVQVIPSFDLRTSKWAVNGAALLGDACHAVSPALGQGMNLAIQGAFELALAIGRALEAGDVREEALRSYERIRRPYVQLIQDTSNLHTFCWMNDNPLIHRIRNRLFQRIGACESIASTQLRIVAGYRSKHPPISQWIRLIGLMPAR